MLPPAAYGGYKDVNEAGMAGALTIGTSAAAVAHGPKELAGAEDLRKGWEERAAIMVYDGNLPGTEAERLAWAALAPYSEKR